MFPVRTNSDLLCGIMANADIFWWNLLKVLITSDQLLLPAAEKSSLLQLPVCYVI